MGLYEKILHIDEEGVNNHALAASIAEIIRGRRTVTQVSTDFGFTAAEQTDLSNLVTRLQSAIPEPINTVTLHELFLLAESRIGPYTTVGALKARLDI